jgi:peptidoglycan/LPS O-acetylase OafA/YrhL
MTLTATPDLPAPREAPRHKYLDALRGVAILLVMGRHNFMAPERAGVLQPIAEVWHHFGWAGVDLFFVLSGFLIGGLVFQELKAHGSFDARRFWLRRALRIYPAYIAYLVWFVLWANYLAAVRPPDQSLAKATRSLWPNLLHLQNYLGSPVSHTWSLAVEEHFYLLLPLVVLLLLRHHRHRPTAGASSTPGASSAVGAAGAAPLHPRAIAVVAYGLALFCSAARIWTCYGVPFDLASHRFPTHLNLDSLFCGVLLAYLHHFSAPARAFAARHGAALLVLGCVLISPMLFLDITEDVFVRTLGISFLQAGFGCVLFALAHAPQNTSRQAPQSTSQNLKWWLAALGSWLALVLARIGIFSYPMYLWHQDLTNLRATEKILFLFTRTNLSAEFQWLYGMAAWLAMSMGVGALVMRIIEKPVLAWRERWVPAPAKAL